MTNVPSLLLRQGLHPWASPRTVIVDGHAMRVPPIPLIERTWQLFDEKIWKEAREEAKSREFNGKYSIFASDIDEKAVQIARENAARAGVADIITFEVADATWFSRKTEGGVIVTNPPYGERLMDPAEARALMRDFGRAARKLSGWAIYIISSDEELERSFGMRADKVRKLYNGMIKCGYFRFSRKGGSK